MKNRRDVKCRCDFFYGLSEKIIIAKVYTNVYVLGVAIMILGLKILFLLVAIYVSYIVITKAVRDGINQSVIGQSIKDQND